MSLTVKRVARLLRKGERGRYLDQIGPSTGERGLYLVVTGTGTGNWLLRYQLSRKVRWLGLGSARVFSLEEARQRAKAARQKLADGIDPLDAKRAERAKLKATAASTKTFKESAEAYIVAKRDEWRSAKHGAQWTASLAQYAYPIIGALDVALVDRPAVLQVLEQKVEASRGNAAGTLWQVRTVTADRVRSRIELVLNYAVARGYRPAGENPAAWATLKHILPAPKKVARVVHYAAVPYAEVPQLVSELRTREGVAAQALTFLILTAARLSEVLGARWDEIDLANAIWTIPAERMKAGKEHKVPLSPPAVALLNGLYRERNNEAVFIGPRGATLSHDALVMVLRRMGHRATAHGFRSSFSDWAHEQSAFSNHVIELSLAHTIGAAAERSYRRGDMIDKRRKLMEAWATYCTTAPVEVSGSTVVPLRSEGRA